MPPCRRVDLAGDAAASFLGDHVPLKMLCGGIAELWPYDVSMRQRIRFEKLAPHRHMLTDILAASEGNLARGFPNRHSKDQLRGKGNMMMMMMMMVLMVVLVVVVMVVMISVVVMVVVKVMATFYGRKGRYARL